MSVSPPSFGRLVIIREITLNDSLRLFHPWFDIPISPVRATPEPVRRYYVLRSEADSGIAWAANNLYLISADGRVYKPGRGAGARNSRE